MALVGIGAAVALVAGGCGGGEKKLTEQQLIKLATPSVVRIQGSTAGGTGVIIDAAHQLVLTNAHVVAGNNSLKAQIGNETGTSDPARIVAESPCDDLAIVKLVDTVPGLKALPLGNSSSATPGEEVTALGFPASAQSGPGASGLVGQSSTVVSTAGRVSQVNVQVNTNPTNANYDPSSPPYQSMIVHQAAVNPGNSGGPLLNPKGQVIGINTLSGHETQGQYYAITTNYAKRLLPDLEAGKSHALVGWDLVQMSGENNPELKEELQTLFQNSEFSNESKDLTNVTADFLEANPTTVGMYDLSDQPGSPAEKANLEGNVLLSINKTPVHTLQDVCNLVNSASPGETLRIEEYQINKGSDINQLSAVQAEVLHHPSGEYIFVADLKMPRE